MPNNDFFSTQSPENHEEKTICCFVIDVSGSMSGERIRELNNGLQQFHQEIQNDPVAADRLEVAIVEFSSTVDTIQTPDLVENFSMPTLTTKGSTRMVDGVNEAIDLVRDRKDWYKTTGQPYNRPWLVLISDGGPDRGQDVNGLATRIENETKNKEFVLLPIGVRGADMNVLNQISGFVQNPETKNWAKMPAMMLDSTKFSEFFKWLSASMAITVNAKPGERVDLADPADWMKGITP